MARADVSYNYAKYTSKNLLARYLNNTFLDSVTELAIKTSPKSILDAGCGEGFVVERLLKERGHPFEKGVSPFLEIVGLDIEEAALRVARQKNPSIKFIQGSVYDLPFEDNRFDLVILAEVLEHLKQPERALTEIKRVAGSFCLVSVPKEPFWRVANMARFKYLTNFGNTPGHLNHWTKKAFLGLLNQHFDLVELKTPFPWTVVLGRNVKR